MTVSQYRISGNLLQLRRSKQSLKQRNVLNDQASSWANVLAGVPQGSILGPFFLLIYIIDLSDDLYSNAKLFADDTSLFSVVYDKNLTAKDLNDDLQKMRIWAHQWKMSFIPDLLKQAQEVIFCRKH